MQVRVLLFASLREAARESDLKLELEVGSPVSRISDELKRRLPERGALIDRCVLAINEEYAPVDQVLREGDTVAVIPPVSGGSSAST